MTHHDPPRSSTETVTDDRAEVLTPREARQGRLGWPVLNVLLGGLVLAMIAWTIVSFVR